MAVSVSAFTAMARKEFAQGKLAADEKPYPAKHEMFTSNIASTVRVETHTFLSNLPRLQRFKGYTSFARLIAKEYTIANEEYRVGLEVKKTDLDDDQVQMHLQTVNSLPNRAKKDVGHILLDHLAAGASRTCFDGSNFFADSHTIGSGDNSITVDNAGNDGVSHRIIALNVDNPVIKPVIFQDREPLSALQTDADTPQAALAKQYQYWVDGRFGMGYGFWWDAINVAITDTPTVPECYTIVETIINQFRSFTLPKGADVDDSLYTHEGWEPTQQNFVLCCNLKLGQILKRALSIAQYTTSGGNVDNVYKDVATIVPTSSLGA